MWRQVRKTKHSQHSCSSIPKSSNRKSESKPCEEQTRCQLQLRDVIPTFCWCLVGDMMAPVVVFCLREVSVAGQDESGVVGKCYVALGRYRRQGTNSMHVLALFRGDAIGSTVSVFFLEDTFHVQAPGMARLMGVSCQMAYPAKCQRSIASILGFVCEYHSAKLYGLGYV